MRKKKQITRRRRAFRWLAVLAFMIAWAVIPGRFRFSPDQAIREAERLGNIGPTQLIAELPGHEGRTLRGNDKGLLILFLEESVSCGWEAQQRTYLDCTEPRPFHVAFSRYHYGYVNMGNWFGRIDDPTAAAVHLEFFERGELWNAYTLKKEDWIEKDGHRYFIVEFEKDGWAQDTFLKGQLLDEQGNVLDSWEAELEFVGKSYGKWMYQ